MADLPDLERTTLLFVGQVTKVEEPRQVHLELTQSVTYTNIQIKMGKKEYIRDPMMVFHPVDKTPSGSPSNKVSPVKVGNVLLVGTAGTSSVIYAQPATSGLLQALHQALEKFVENRVNSYLKDHGFSITLALDDNNAFLDGQLLTLDEITDRTLSALEIKLGEIPEASRANIFKYVQNYYEACKKNLTSDWQWTIQIGHNPQVPFWASRPQPPGTLGYWQQGQQATLGYQSAQVGWIHTVQLAGSILDAKPIFSNVLASYQFSYARMLGNPIFASGPADNWSYLLGTVFAQVGVGAGNNSGDNSVHLGLMAQTQAGGQISLAIWKLQVIVQGAVVYSLLWDRGSSFGAAAFGGIQYGF